MKWTYEQRREALNDLHRINRDADVEPYNSGVSYNSDLVDLACQRNELLEACKEFVRKCECGEARSIRSYAQMKAAIANTESL